MRWESFDSSSHAWQDRTSIYAATAGTGMIIGGGGTLVSTSVADTALGERMNSRENLQYRDSASLAAAWVHPVPAA